MATLLSRSPRRLLRFPKPQTLLSPALTPPSPPHDLPARIPPLGFRESGWSAPPQWQLWHRALCTHSDPWSSGSCDAGLAAAAGALPDVAQASADKGVGANGNGAHQAAAKKAMGRELSMANVSIGGVTLVLGTSHLESPRREAPWWDHDMSRNKRAAQAKESLMLLGGRGSSNVIFCGDMNWDDKIDGPFLLPDGWVDAWAELKPDEGGWTYDTVANAMLSKGFKKLQLRLDRFVCKLPDFEVQGIEMVAKEPIPGVSYEKVKEFSHKSKSGKKFSGTWEWMLPVLPSDHFGLVLTIAPRAASCALSD